MYLDNNFQQCCVFSEENRSYIKNGRGPRTEPWGTPCTDRCDLDTIHLQDTPNQHTMIKMIWTPFST